MNVFHDGELSLDKFLYGQLHLWQPVKGYRAATDAVFLAAACTAKAGDRILDLGCGAGTVSLCLGWRVSGLTLAGLELQPAYAALARRNATLNAISMDVIEGDITDMPQILRRDFDHVVVNPPYYPPEGTSSPIDARATAMQINIPSHIWVATAIKRVKPLGWLTMIVTSNLLPNILASMGNKMGSVTVLPITSRSGQAANRLIIRARKGGKGHLQLLYPFITHTGLAHDGDRESYTPEANAILREGRDLTALFK